MLDATHPQAAGPGGATNQKSATPRRGAREEVRYADVHVSVGGVHHTIEVELVGEYRRAYPAMYESGSSLPVSPAEPGGFVLDRVEYGCREITHLFTEAQLRVLLQEAA